MERTFAIIKPDAVERHFTGAILALPVAAALAVVVDELRQVRLASNLLLGEEVAAVPADEASGVDASAR